MSGHKHWAEIFGSKVISGFLVGFGLLLIVFTQFLLPKFANAGFITGLCLVLAGIIGLLLRDASER